MLNLRPLIGSDRIANIYRWHQQDKDPHIFRIYMEFCNYGDLWGLIENYTPKVDAAFNISKRGFIPEPFLWKLFEDVVIAGILMERGDLEPTTKPWGVIVHRDWRSENVFLGENTSGLYEGYPTAKTADFGWCTILPVQEKTQPMFKDFTNWDDWVHWPPVS